MAEYGTQATEGIVLEGDSSHYAWGAPHYLLPDMASHAITDPLIDGKYHVLLPVAQGLTVADTLRDGLDVTKLLTTSSTAFSKLAGYAMETYDKAEGDIEGPFALCLAITDALLLRSGNQDRMGSPRPLCWTTAPTPRFPAAIWTCSSTRLTGCAHRRTAFPSVPRAWITSI